VLGHQACGAVDATIKSINKDNTMLPGHLPALVAAISPRSRRSSEKPGDALDNAIRQNVLITMERLKNGYTDHQRARGAEEGGWRVVCITLPLAASIW
jgi:carbonic anhydrase